MTMPTPQIDRRKTPRRPAGGRIEITFGDLAPVHVEAELVEMSSKGFRAAHNSKILEPGLEVMCKREGAEPIRARVIWTHVLGGQRLSGFLVL